MKTNQPLIRFLAPLAITGLLSAVGFAAAPPDTTVPPVGQKAGKITALLPTAHVVRGAGKKAVTTDAIKGEDLVWQDLVKTDKGGRARITLNDQSILSLGSQAELRIVKHDARAQQTALEMTYGRIRAQVSSITRDGGSFQLRTPTAVAGVIGTDFGADSGTPGVTTMVCITGLTQVSNADPSVSGTVPCAAGQTTTVKSGMPPTPPQPATQQQINQLITDTEPAIISAFAPASALVGTTLDAIATGTHMAGINGATITGNGVQITLGPNGTATSATAHLVIAATAQPGPRAVTFTKVNGADTAAVFTVIAPPGLQGTDAASLKKRYTDILTTEQQSADSSNATIKGTLQQEADQGLQTVQQNNAKLPQPLSTDQLSQQLNNIIAGVTASGASREAQAYSNASSAVDQIVTAILSKIQDGSEPTANIAADLDKQFAPINESFQSAMSQIHTDLASQAGTQIQSIDQLVANFEQSLAASAQQQAAPPVPKVDSDERTLEAGVQASFDASGSSALGGASIAGVSWVLCDPSYKPAQVGVVLPANNSGCRAVPGFASTGGQFQFDTCSLNPADYVARVIVTDSNGKASAMDVRLHVTQPGYDDPPTRLQGLAAAYTQLQSQQFLAYFDPTYSGYTQLQENIRNTFLNLSSMQINLRVSQSSITCNDATIRADWQQNYTFKGDQTCANAQAGTSCQKVLFKQTEQLTARMTRLPGKGWFITDFQGDNGTVQGVPPGPQTTFTAQPELQVTSLQIVTSSTSTQVQRRQTSAHTARATQQSVVGLASGVNHFVATVTNIGNAPLTQQPQLHFALLDANSNEITGDTEPLPTLPLNPGDSETVNGTLTVPTLPPSTQVNVGATVNPGCQVQEQTCGTNNFVSVPAVAGTIDLAVTQIAPVGQYVGTLNGTLNVSITNNGTAPSVASTGNLLLTSTDFPGTLGFANIPSVPGAGTVVVPISFVVPNSPGQHNIKVGIVPPAAGDAVPGNDSASGSLNFTVADAYAITSIASATTPNPPTGGNALQLGQNLTVQITVANTGTTSPTGNITVQLNCTAPCQLTNPPTTTVPAPAAGTSSVASVTINNLQVAPGTGYVATATITSAPPQSTTAGNSASITFDVTDFTLTNSLGFSGDLNVQVGSQGFFNVNLTEPQGLAAVSIPVAITPAITGVNYATNSPYAAGSSNPVVLLTNSTAPVGTSSLVSVTGTRFGVSRAATQSVRFFTATLENFSAGQPGSSQIQPIILPINGAAQSLTLRLSGNFFNPGGGAQLGFPTVTGINITPSATVAAAGDTIQVQIAAVQGAAINQTVPLVFTAQVPNMNPPVPETLTVFVRPTALPDLAVTGSVVNGRNFTTNPWLSGEPLDYVVTVANNGPGPSNGFENLHLFLNGAELKRGGVTVPQALQPNTSVNVTVHAVAPDPVSTGSGTVVVKVDEDQIGDANPSNDSLNLVIPTSDWKIAISSGQNAGDTDTNALPVTAGGSAIAVIAPSLSGSGDFLTPVSVGNGIISSRITATPGLTFFTSTQQQIRYVISATSTAAQGFYAAQLIARFVDGGRATAQRQATVHINVANLNNTGDSVNVTSNRNNACTSGCTPVEINGLLIENLNLTVTRNSGQTSGSVDLHFTDPASVISDVTSSGSAQNPILNGVSYGAPTNVFFAAAQDATGAVTTAMSAPVIVSATSIQTFAARGTPTPDAVGPNQTTLLFNVGDLQLSSVPCLNIAPGVEGVLQLNFTTLSGFNSPTITWNVAALPAGVVLNSVTPSSTFNGSGYSPVSIDLTNNNPTDITTPQPLTLVGTISNANGSASVIFAPTIQLHSGTCNLGTRNAVIDGGAIAGGTRGVWRHGATAGAIARSNVIRQTTASMADIRLLPGDVSYTPSLPKSGDTVQVRFRLTNLGTSEARDVPVALLVNGTVVASDTFDVGVGKTVLGGLQWTNAQLPRSSVSVATTAVLVVDPARNARAAIASGKIAPLSHFALSGTVSSGGAPIGALGSPQRVLIQIAESACSGFRFSSGASSTCGSSDVEIAFEDAATGRFSLTSSRGISDLGFADNASGGTNAQYTSRLMAAAGHSYAVQLDGGRVGILTIRAIRNPNQKSAAADKVFRGGPSRRIARKLGKTTDPVETGDVSGAATHDNTIATLDVLYNNP